MISLRCLTLLLVAVLATPLAAQDTRKLVDPPKAAATVIEDPVKDIALPAGVVMPEVAFAAQHGPFVAIGGRDGPRFKYQIFSLKDGSITATIDNADLGKIGLSPDGSQIACMGSSGRNHVVKTLDVKTKKVLKTIDIGARGENVEYLDAERFYVVYTFPPKKVVVWSSTTGKKLSEFAIDPQGFDNPIAVSPGGNWLVTANKEKIVARSASGSEEVTVAEVPKIGHFAAAPEGLAFSADGKTLACLYDSAGKRYLVLHDLAAGTSKNQVEIEGRPNHMFRGNALAATPDGKGWLVQGDIMLEGDSGKPLWPIPEEKRGDTAARALAVNQVLSVQSMRDKKIYAANVPKDKVGDMQAIAKAGGDARDAMRGKLAAVNVAAAKKVTIPLGNIPWSGAVIVVPDASKLAVRSFATGIPGQQFGSLAFSDAATGILAVEKRSSDHMARDKGAAAIDTYNLLTGQAIASVTLPAPGLLQSVAPDGQSVLVLDGEKQDRLDVLALADGKNIAAWKPYETAGSDSKVTFAAMIDAKRVLTMNGRGTMIVWSLPEVKAEAIAEAPMLRYGRLTPDRKYFAALDGETLRLFDLATLEPRGDAQPAASGKKGTPHAIAFNTAGTEVAGLFEDPSRIQWFVQRWDAKTGKSLGRVDVPMIRHFGTNVPVTFQYAGPYFLIDNRTLYDPNAKEIAWSFSSTAVHASRVIDAPDERLWYGMAEFFTKPANVVAAVVPGPEVEAMIAEVKKSTDHVLKPGTKISLKYEGGGERGTALADKVREGAKAAAAAAGHVLADAGDCELVVNLIEKDKNENAEYRMTGRPGTVSVHLFEVMVTGTLQRGGQTIWQAPGTRYGMNQFFVRMPANETDVAEYLRKQMWEASAGWVRNLALPRMLVQTPNGVIAYPGHSTLTPDGLKAMPLGTVP